MYKEYDYIIVGAGLCGLVLAKELTRSDKAVLVLERGRFLNKLGKIRNAYFFYDKHALAGSREGTHIYRVFGVGGTSIVSCGNAVEFTNDEYSRIGIDFKEFIPEAKEEGNVKDSGLPIGNASQKIMEVASRLGYDMKPMPKFNMTVNCISCGNCCLGCAFGMKWTSVECLKKVNKKNLTLMTEAFVEKVITSNGKAIGVKMGRKNSVFFAKKIILSAGGIGTPIIIQKTGIEGGDNLFIDLFINTYGLSKEFNQKRELGMSVVCTKFHSSEGFILSPFIDNWISLSSDVNWHYISNAFRMHRLMGIMTKISDDANGKVHANGKIDKVPTENDIKKLKKGSNIAREILINCGVNPKTIFVTRPKGAHPGGTAAIGKIVNSNLETKVKNLYVCDASVLPFAPGLPPMLTLIALTKWFARNILKE